MSTVYAIDNNLDETTYQDEINDINEALTDDYSSTSSEVGDDESGGLISVEDEISENTSSSELEEELYKEIDSEETESTLVDFDEEESEETNDSSLISDELIEKEEEIATSGTTSSINNETSELIEEENQEIIDNLEEIETNYNTQPTSIDEVQNEINKLMPDFYKPMWQYEVIDELMPNGYSCDAVYDEELGVRYYSWIMGAG